MGVFNMPLQKAQKMRKIFIGRIQYAPTKGIKDEKKYILGVFNTPLQSVKKDEKFLIQKI